MAYQETADQPGGLPLSDAAGARFEHAPGASTAAIGGAGLAAPSMRKPHMRLLYCPPLPLLWSARPGDGRPASRIHKLYLRGLWRKPWTERLGVALSFLAWPLIALATAIVATALNGRQASRSSGRGIAALFVEQIRLAARHGILPPWYFVYELHQPERRTWAPAYINRYEAKGGLYKLLRYYAGSRDDKTLNDKSAFFRACRAGGLATPEVLVELRDGAATWVAPGDCFPDCDLFAKEIRGRGGAGAERWLLAGPGRWRGDKGTELDGEALLERFRRLSRRRPLLVQRRVRNHEALADLNCDGLATVRILSIWDEDGRPEVTNAAFKMPARPGSIVDNFCAGGLAASVDLATGRLGPATNLGLLETLRWRDTHPVSGARIEGRALPLWPDILAFSRQVHETFISFPVVGLDVAITPDGPYLIEANGSSALDLIQRTARAPLGDARFGALFARHLERAEAWRRAVLGEPGERPQAERGRARRGRRRLGLRIRPMELGKKVLLSGPAVLWTRLPNGDAPAMRIHRMVHRTLWREASPAARLGFCLGFLVWVPLIFALDAVCLAAHGAEVKRRTAKSFLRQGVEQIGLAARHAIPPLSYYAFGLYDDRKRAEALSYLYRFELKGDGVYTLLRRKFSSPETTEALSDKAAFALRCEAHGVPVVPVASVAEDGVLRAHEPGADPLPQVGLFVKPLRGSGGEGASAWAWCEDGTWRSNAGREATAADLADYLRALSGAKPYVVRVLVANHREIQGLGAGALSTVRVITCLDEHGRPEVTDALFKMSVRPEAIVDNYHAGGIVAPVDVATGTLGEASAGSHVWRTHPLTGAPIAGRGLPMWEDVLDVALRAHAAFADHVAIGWDIAILDDGPKLVEGNKSPGLDSIQKTLGGPIGSRRLGALLALHLERALDPAGA